MIKKFILLACVSVLALTPCAGFSQVPISQHVVLVIDENTSFSTAFPTGMPWMSNEGKTYGYANNFFSDVSGSLLDYLILASGSSETAFHCNGNDCFFPGTTNKDPITDENIFHLLGSQGISWKVYAENYLNAGGTVNTPDWNSNGKATHYYARHNAAVWYSYVLSNTLGSQGQIVDFEQFGIDLQNGALPRFSIIVPDGTFDRHDGTLAQADSFLQNTLTPLLNTSDFQPGGSGLLIITFDNGDGDAAGKVFTGLMGPNVKAAFVSNVSYKHENTLRTMLDSLGIHTYPGMSATAADMSDFFRSNAGGVAIDAPANQSTQGTSVLVKATASELGSSIDHMEVWDNGAKLANVFASTVDQSFTLGTGAHQMTVQDIGPGPGFAVLHKETTSFTVSATNGVSISTPASGSTQAVFFPVHASAVNGGTQIDHLEVWADGSKLGDSPKGAVISQWFTLPAGSHTLTVQSMTSGGAVLNKSIITFTASSANGVYVNTPANNATVTATIPINAYSYEQNGSTAVVDHMEVWDNTHGVKLANSPTGTGVTSLFMNQNVTVDTATYGFGTYQLAISDISAGTFQTIHTTLVNVNVQ
jgi:phosphatidylinositol-3-phosphatase